jgi:hypothetical protein
MKIFIRADDLAAKRPTIIAAYEDNVEIADNAHGDGMTVLYLPKDVMKIPKAGEVEGGGMMYLAPDWRERAGSMPVEGEAKRRIEEVFSISDRLNVLQDMIEAITTHGADSSRWPPEARKNKTSFDEQQRYITEVRSKAREHLAALPRDPSGEKLWPQRPRPVKASPPPQVSAFPPAVGLADLTKK